MVEGGVGGEAGSVVDLKQEHPVLVVHHEVEPQQLKAHIVGGLLGTAQLIVGEQVRLGSNDSFNDDVLDLAPIQVGPVPLLLQILEKLREGLLVSVRHIID